MIEKAERLMDGANPEDREGMVDLIKTVRNALDTGEAESLEQAVSLLTDLLYYLES